MREIFYPNKNIVVADFDYQSVVFRYKNSHPELDIKVINRNELINKISYSFKKDPIPFLISKGIGYKKANFKRRYNELFPLRRLRRCHADFVSPNNRLLHFFFVNRMRVYGYPIYVWTVNDERTMRRLFRAKVDGIITDRPDIALGLR